MGILVVWTHVVNLAVFLILATGTIVATTFTLWFIARITKGIAPPYRLIWFIIFFGGALGVPLLIKELFIKIIL